MKAKAIVLYGLGCLFQLSFSSCLDVQNNPVATQHVTLTPQQVYVTNLSAFGMEEGAVVDVKPGHAYISEIITDNLTGALVYRYQALADFKGNDFVQIRTSRGSTGGADNPLIKITKINYTINE